MTSTIIGTLYVKQNIHKTIFTGVFTLDRLIPFYVYDTKGKENSIWPHTLLSNKKTYEGRIYCKESPALGIPLVQKTKFKFLSEFNGLKLKKTLILPNNIAYIELIHELGTFFLIPQESVLAIQYDLVL